MWIPFEELPAHARVWIYQANRPLSAAEKQTVQDHLEIRIRSWDSHGNAMIGSSRLLHDRFVVIAADETQQAPSGCSIDQSVGWLRELGNELGVDFFDRSVAFLREERLESVPLNALKKHVELGTIHPQTVVFNHAIGSKAQLDTAWQTAAKDSWLARYFVASKLPV
ncbi:MAG: hypothetical protein H7Z75_12025 [Ferruginibacter sp.]|nr:hypothetical protein [Cytophagales bacterium]